MVTTFTQDLHRIEIISVKYNILKNPLYIRHLSIKPNGEYVTLYLNDIDITLRINYGYNVELCKRALKEIFENIPNFEIAGGDSVDSIINKFADAIQYRHLYDEA